MKKLKILWVAPYPYEIAKQSKENKPAHFSSWITSLAEKLKEHVDLTIISTSRKISQDQSFYSDGIEYFFYKTNHPFYEIISLFQSNVNILRKRFKNFDFTKFNLIHIHGTEHQYASALKNVELPKVISIQGLLFKSYEYTKFPSYNYYRWRILKKYELREIKFNKNFMCRTHWDRGSIKKINSEAIIYDNWEIIRTPFFSDTFEYESYNLIYLGGLVKLKGINEVLIAFKHLHANGYNYTLTICGSGNSKKLYKLLKKHQMINLENYISFQGKKTAQELVALYKNSFCLLHPTYIDNSPNSVCEAQVAGLPVIASNVGGVSSLIENNNSGILVERYQTKEITEAILKLKTDRNLYYKISKAAKEIARERHNPEIILSKTLSIYNNILN